MPVPMVPEQSREVYESFSPILTSIGCLFCLWALVTGVERISMLFLIAVHSFNSVYKVPIVK